MIVKYLKKTGEVIASFPESKYLPPGDQIGKVEAFEDGKKQYDEDDLETLILEGEIPTEYQDPTTGLMVGDLVIKKTKHGLEIKDKKTKEKFKGEKITRFYTQHEQPKKS